jgi:hypothetical protein
MWVLPARFFLDAACDRVFLADTCLYRLLHNGAARGWWISATPWGVPNPLSDQPAVRMHLLMDPSTATRPNSSGRADGFRLDADTLTTTITASLEIAAVCAAVAGCSDG